MAEPEIQDEWTQEGQDANTPNDDASTPNERVSQQVDESNDGGVLQEVIDNDPAFGLEKKIKDKLTGDK